MHGFWEICIVVDSGSFFLNPVDSGSYIFFFKILAKYFNGELICICFVMIMFLDD